MVSVATETTRIPPTQETRTIEEQEARREVNVGMGERVALGVLGGLLAGRALSHPTVPRLIAGAIGGALMYRSATGYCPGYDKLGIDTARKGAAALPHDYYKNGIHVEMAYTVMRKPEELYEYWRQLENLPRFMHHLEAVTKIDERRSRWVARGPAGRSVAWDAEIINDEPGRLLAWRSLANADVDNAGSIRFLPAPGNRGTEVRVSIEYIPPAGRIGRAVAWLFGEEPRQQIQEDLRRFKRLVETGEIPSTLGQPKGHCAMGS